MAGWLLSLNNGPIVDEFLFAANDLAYAYFLFQPQSSNNPPLVLASSVL